MSTRTDKVAMQIQKDLGPILDAAAKQVLEGALATVLEVQVTPDLSIAKIYLSIFNSSNKAKDFIIIKKQTKTIRKYLAQKIRNQVRVIPELVFFLDEGADRAERIDQLLKNLK